MLLVLLDPTGVLMRFLLFFPLLLDRVLVVLLLPDVKPLEEADEIEML